MTKTSVARLLLIITTLLFLLDHRMTLAWPVTPNLMPEFSLHKITSDLDQYRSDSHTANLIKRHSPKSLQMRTLPADFRPPRDRLMEMITYRTVMALTPVAAAAKALEDFYAEVAIKAAQLWSTEDEEWDIFYEKGQFRLNFRCIGDTIPWKFVQKTAEQLWETASMQKTDLFDAFWTDSTARVIINVWLEIVDASQPSSEEGFREGSVPSVTSDFQPIPDR